MTRRTLNAKLEKLFDVLKEVEEKNLKLSARDFEQKVVAVTAYNDKSWKTYRGKYLDGALVFSDDVDPVLLRVRGACAMTPEQFRQLMSQSKRNKSLPLMNEATWREQIRMLARQGRQHQFMLTPEDIPLVQALFQRQRNLF